jgi:hypothetical protein
MRDYCRRDDEGRDVPVAQLSTEEIREHLATGVEALGPESVEAIMERLRLELFIRERGLRTPDPG